MVGGHELIGAGHLSGRDHKCVRQTQRSVTSPQTRRLGCNSGVEFDDCDWQAAHKGESDLDLGLATPSRRDETLGKRGRSDC